MYLRIVFITSIIALTKQDEYRSSLRLCPPGGQLFATAYMMACDMRRRRKRNIDSSMKFRTPTLEEMQLICCEIGCEIGDLLNYCDPFGDFIN